MTRGRKPKSNDWDEVAEEKLEEELTGRKKLCTCDEDPEWCEKHGGWG